MAESKVGAPAAADNAAAGETPAQLRCRKVAAEVTAQLAHIKKFNPLRPCTQDQPPEKPAAPRSAFGHMPDFIRWATASALDEATPEIALTVCNV